MATGFVDGAPRAKDGTRSTSGRYGLIAEVGRSYLGALWIARDTTADARTAFVRRVTPLVAATARAAILDSARWAQDTCGDRSVEIIEHRAGVDFATPFVDAEPLRGLLRTAAFRHVATPPEVIFGIVLALLDELTTHHETGSTHTFGGVHPDSLLVGLDGRVHLLDVGVGAAASAREPWRSDAARIGYFAPEQVEPKAAPDARTDVFGVGVVLWEALTNRRLFPGNDAKTVKDRVQKGAIARLDATRPSGVSGTPTPVAEVVARSLERAPAARFQTASEMRAAVAALGAANADAVATWVKSLADLAISKRRQLLDRSSSQPAPQGRRESLPPGGNRASEAPVAVRTPSATPEAAAPAPIAVEPRPVETEAAARATPAALDLAPQTLLEPTPPAPARLDLFAVSSEPGAHTPDPMTAPDTTQNVPTPFMEADSDAAHSERRLRDSAPATTPESQHFDEAPGSTETEVAQTPDMDGDIEDDDVGSDPESSAQDPNASEPAESAPVNPRSIPDTAKSRAPSPPSKRAGVSLRPPPKPSLSPKPRPADAVLPPLPEAAAPAPIHTSAFATLTAAPKSRGSRRLALPVALATAAVAALGVGYWLGRGDTKTESNRPRLTEVKQIDVLNAPVPSAAPSATSEPSASSQPTAAAAASVAEPVAPQPSTAPVAPEATAVTSAVATAASDAPQEATKEEPKTPGAAPAAAEPSRVDKPTPTAGANHVEATSVHAAESAAPVEAAHRPPPSHTPPNSSYKPGGI